MKKLLLSIVLFSIVSFSQVFPNRPLADSDLGVAVNRVSGSLTTGITPTTTSFGVNLDSSSNCLSPYNIITIDSEYILAGSGTTCSTVNNATRGYGSSGTFYHNTASRVSVNVNALYVGNVANELKNLENTIQPNWSNIVAANSAAPNVANGPVVLDSNGNANFPGNVSVGNTVLPAITIATTALTTYNLAAANNGQQIAFSAATDVTLNITSAVAVQGFTILIIQRGIGNVIPTVSGGGIVIRQRQGFTKTGGQYAVATLSCDISGDCILAGDLQ